MAPATRGTCHSDGGILQSATGRRRRCQERKRDSMHLRCWRGAGTARSYLQGKPVGVLPVHAGQSCAEQVQHQAQRLPVHSLPLLVVVSGCVFAYLVKAVDHGIRIVKSSSATISFSSLTLPKRNQSWIIEKNRSL
ncbi:unnamed protein product [Musa acuminata subsp. burmannicoides]